MAVKNVCPAERNSFRTVTLSNKNHVKDDPDNFQIRLIFMTAKLAILPGNKCHSGIYF